MISNKLITVVKDDVLSIDKVLINNTMAYL